jgi:hypothetical protein
MDQINEISSSDDYLWLQPLELDLSEIDTEPLLIDQLPLLDPIFEEQLLYEDNEVVAEHIIELNDDEDTVLCLDGYNVDVSYEFDEFLINHIRDHFDESALRDYYREAMTLRDRKDRNNLFLTTFIA